MKFHVLILLLLKYYWSHETFFSPKHLHTTKSAIGYLLGWQKWLVIDYSVILIVSIRKYYFLLSFSPCWQLFLKGSMCVFLNDYLRMDILTRNSYVVWSNYSSTYKEVAGVVSSFSVVADILLLLHYWRYYTPFSLAIFFSCYSGVFSLVKLP